MPDDYGCTRDPLIRAFGAVLRAHRETAGLSRPQLAEALGCQPGWIEKLETAQKPPSEATADDLDVYFSTPNRLFWLMWLEIKREGKHPALPPGFSGFVAREAKASAMYIFENMAITGLFQTRDYAYEVLKIGRKPDEIEQLLAKRLERQEIIYRHDPPQIVAVFDEAVIRRVIGSLEVMGDQIRRLMASGGVHHSQSRGWTGPRLHGGPTRRTTHRPESRCQMVFAALQSDSGRFHA
jgi:transcriptional regulator with XRE-family HTH domain